MSEDTGWLAFTQATSPDRLGEYGNWHDEEDALIDNSEVAECDVGKDHYGDWLYLYNPSAISIPAGSTIDGIQLMIKRAAESTNRISDSSLKLAIDESQSGDDKASSNTWSDSLETVYYGGAEDLWGTTYDIDDVTDSNFGIMLSADCDGYDAYADVSYMAIKIYYTVPATMAQMMNHYKRLRA